MAFQLSFTQAESVCRRNDRFDQLAAFELFLTERPVIEHRHNVPWSRPASFGVFSLRPHPGYLSCPMVRTDSCQFNYGCDAGVQNEQQIDIPQL